MININVLNSCLLVNVLILQGGKKKIYIYITNAFGSELDKLTGVFTKAGENIFFIIALLLFISLIYIKTALVARYDKLSDIRSFYLRISVLCVG